jgi:hypothetical protein
MMSTKVLIVLDSIYRFGNGATPAGQQDFTYITLVDALTAAGMQVTKAHRGSDSTANLQNFNFATASLLDFNVIWLIGFAGRNSAANPPVGSSTMGGLGPAQLNALSAFMEAGGGVFATGDHDSIGADMSGYLPRVRAMRCWYGQSDGASPMPAGFPFNFPPLSTNRADTTRPNPAGVYTDHPSPFVWFENQSDAVPQSITPTSSPAHPILRRAGRDITVYPDHMHEGRTLGVEASYDYTQASPFGDTGRQEFREIAGHRELPAIIATGRIPGNAVFSVGGDGNTDVAVAASDPMKPLNTLSVYDGRQAGVGRVATGATFHHYVDVNLTGDTDVVVGPRATKVGSDAIKGHGFNDDTAVFDDIKAVYVNITNWLARPRPAIGLILERSTFSQDEVAASPMATFPSAVLVSVDGFMPNQFPGGGITALGTPPGLAGWAPTITPAGGVPIAIEATSVDSDDPTLPDRVQRFTFTYRVRFTGDAFTFGGSNNVVPVTSTLAASGVTAPLTDAAWLQLVKSANPFMLDLSGGNDTAWLSSDIRVFRVIAGDSFNGIGLPAGATRAQALAFIRSVVSTITPAQFEALPSADEASALSTLPMTTAFPQRRVYNFALARVRLSMAGGDASAVRVFFRIFTTQTTAALTYHVNGGGMPLEGYLRTAGANPIALPGTQSGGTEWLSFPFFSAERQSPPSAQTDPDNVQTVQASAGGRMFGALLDNNLMDGYLTQTPVSGGAAQPLPTLLMGEHQCLVTQIEFAGTPIPDGATPWTSDKLSQRNIALSTVANPGLDASRVAMHTFEIEATPQAIGDALPPDELLLHWSKETPSDTILRLHIPTWNAHDVVELADRLYARHEIAAVDAHTIELPGGGTRYVPLPRSMQRQTGVIAAEFPLGIRKGQRFDVSVRQVTNKVRRAKVPPPKVTQISIDEAARRLAERPRVGVAPEAGFEKGAFDLGNNLTLVTDLSLLDAIGDHALLIEHADRALVDAALLDAGRWRETIGAFQLGVPVSTKCDMLLHQLQLLSVMRWRTAHVPRRSRWRPTMEHFVDLLAAKVQALGGDPSAVPATPDGAIPQVTDPGAGGGGGTPGGGGPIGGWLFGPLGCGLLVALLLFLLWLLLRWP